MMDYFALFIFFLFVFENHSQIDLWQEILLLSNDDTFGMVRMRS